MHIQNRKTYSAIEMMFISKIIGVEVQDLYLNLFELNPEQSIILKKYNNLYQSGYPIDYILGKIKLMGYSFTLNEKVLIPRPETEDLISKIMVFRTKTPLLVDIGTGCGLIGITLSKHFSQVVLTDISSQALSVAESNVQLNMLSNCKTILSDLLISKEIVYYIEKHKSWTLVSNLPYLPEHERSRAVEHKVQFEPEIALYSGKDGLDSFRKLVNQLSSAPLPSYCFFELDPSNIYQAGHIITKLGYNIQIDKDNNNLDRYLICKLTQNTI